MFFRETAYPYGDLVLIENNKCRVNAYYTLQYAVVVRKMLITSITTLNTTRYHPLLAELLLILHETLVHSFTLTIRTFEFEWQS